MREDDDAMMKEIARQLRAPLSPPVSGSFDARVMSAVRRMPRHSRFKLWSRLTTPRTVTFTPLSWGFLAASVALLAVIGAARAFDDIQVATKPMVTALFPKTATQQPPQRVQFVLRFKARDDLSGLDAISKLSAGLDQATGNAKSERFGIGAADGTNPTWLGRLNVLSIPLPVLRERAG